MLCRLFLIVVLASCNACGTGDRHSYFPLGDSSWWEYSVRFTYRGEPREQRLILANQAPVNVDNEKYFPRRSASNHTDYFQKNEQGISHIDPVKGDRTWILRQPYEIGTEWQETSKVSKLELLGGAFTATYMARIQRPVTMSYKIESLDDTVKVNGIRYTNCLRVRSKGRLYAGSTLEEFMNISSINIDQTEWYAPGVGLVKSVRKEFTSPKEFKNEYIQELLSFRRG